MVKVSITVSLIVNGETLREGPELEGEQLDLLLDVGQVTVDRVGILEKGVHRGLDVPGVAGVEAEPPVALIQPGVSEGDAAVDPDLLLDGLVAVVEPMPGVVAGDVDVAAP